MTAIPKTDGGNNVIDATLDRIRAVRASLLELHRLLIASERIEYERLHGRVESSGQILQLVANDPWFAWLHPMSEAIVQLDELLEQDEPLEGPDADPVMAQIRAMTIDANGAGDYAKRYQAAVQRDPDVVIQHVRLTKALS